MEMVFKKNYRQDYIESIKAAFLTIAKKNLVSYLASAAPFLSWGPIAPVVAMLIELLLSKALSGAETLIFFKFLDFRIATQSKNFTEAAMKNYLAQQNGTKEEKDAAEKELIKAHDDFVKLNNI